MSAFRRNGPPGKPAGRKRFGGGGDFKPRGFGGGKVFKSRAFGERGGYGARDGARTQMHEATCASCGNRCEVPFRPTGSKPIYCKDCFQKDGTAPRAKFGDAGSARPKFGAERAFDAGPKAGDDVARKLEDMNAKLDRIIRDIEALKERNA